MTNARRGDAMRARWADPDYRDRMRTVQRTKWEDPEHRLKVFLARSAPSHDLLVEFERRLRKMAGVRE